MWDCFSGFFSILFVCLFVCCFLNTLFITMLKWLPVRRVNLRSHVIVISGQ